jgi:hypothetical protein
MKDTEVKGLQFQTSLGKKYLQGKVPSQWKKAGYGGTCPLS